jgi:hypothetical protein
MKKIILPLAFLLASFPVLADMDMMGQGINGVGLHGMGTYGLIYLILCAFIFSIIFWWTYNWIVVIKKK